MKHRKTLFFISINAILACPTARALSLEGNYYHVSTYGREPSGMLQLVETALFIDGDSCRVTEMGFQIYEVYKCEVHQAGKKFQIKFQSYCNGSPLNSINLSPYKDHDTLFTVEPEDDHLLVEWKKMELKGTPLKNIKTFSRTAKNHEDPCAGNG